MSNGPRERYFGFSTLRLVSRIPRPAERLKNGSTAAQGRGQSNSRANALDRLYFSVPPDDERVSRRIGYVLLGVTFVLAIVAFWPWLS